MTQPSRLTPVPVSLPSVEQGVEVVALDGLPEHEGGVLTTDGRILFSLDLIVEQYGNNAHAMRQGIEAHPEATDLDRGKVEGIEFVLDLLHREANAMREDAGFEPREKPEPVDPFAALIARIFDGIDLDDLDD